MLLFNISGGRGLAVQHPVASCVLCVIIAGSGTIISSMLLGEPLLNSVLNERGILSGVFIWFLVHFSPGDRVYMISSSIYVQVIISNAFLRPFFLCV